MRVGVPKEIKRNEYRVGLTPSAVREYVHNGHSVLVETKAGDGRRLSRRRLHSAPAPRSRRTPRRCSTAPR